MTQDELLKYCRLYKGEPDMGSNPISKDADEFKWFMWNVEYSIVRAAKKENIASKDYEDFFKKFLFNQIDTFAGAPFGSDPRPYYEKYFDF